MKKRVRSIVFASGWLCTSPQENEFVDRGVGHAFESGSNIDIDPRNVSCNCLILNKLEA